ncbi:lipopolysaccharide heptosyltransferase II [Methylacidimicrobium tartarophylax]|uniref:lipopolysaccharide heptosyltransferase II n=1 Tax=Methylacidimicrobium tartarophylax TaxID=1041768 RepID=A0A5E6M8Q3_9BACT|nr:lipopolysaccharide heptosyltransferase II [Methylacidimicrobium tartarophylax]VVM05317.1 heptosyltransferase II [Methylacidimicrobium tartarophylax]
MIPPPSLLVRSPNWLGDAVLSLPAVASLKRWLGGGPLAVATPDKLRALWDLCPFVDRVVALDRPNCLLCTAQRLREGKFEAALLLPNSPRSALEARLAGIPRIWGKTAWPRSVLLSRPVLRGEPGETFPRQAASYLALAQELGASGSLATPELRPIASSGQPPEPVIAFCPGAEYGPAKRWPAESYMILARRLHAATGYPVRLYGAAGDREICRQIASAVPGVESLAGQTSLEEFLSALAHARLVVCNDSGAMHVAALLGVPVVALFGSTDPVRTGPLGTTTRVLSHPVPCGPCFLRTCPRDLACLRQIHPEAVFSACLEQLGCSPTVSS